LKVLEVDKKSFEVAQRTATAVVVCSGPKHEMLAEIAPTCIDAMRGRSELQPRRSARGREQKLTN
jgi:hypothetical protein